MQYVSTTRDSAPVSLREAVTTVSPDLYMPAEIPRLSYLPREMHGAPYPSVVAQVLWPYVQGEMPRSELEAMTRRAYTFHPTVKRIDESTTMLDLATGVPTESFKPFGVRMAAQLILHFLNGNKTMLSATSGDTGGAVSDAFAGSGLRNIILFNYLTATDVQRRDMTTNGATAIGTENDFNHLYGLLRTAETDPDVRDKILTANSRNIGRLLPQAAYFFYYCTTADNPEVIFSIPFGNGSDFVSGEIARRMGLPVPMLIAPSNANDTFPRFVNTGRYEPKDTVRTLSPAMDVSNPGGAGRFVHLYGGRMDKNNKILVPPEWDFVHEGVYAVSISDERTAEAMRRMHEKGFLMDPHGSVAAAGAEDFREKRPEYRDTEIAIVETASPSKFADTVERITGERPKLTEDMQRKALMQERWIKEPNLTYGRLKEIILA